MFSLLLPLAGCALSSPEPIDPGPALSDVQQSLSSLVERFGAGDPAASKAWGTAHGRFEADLEPFLRERLDPVEVARTEYAFGRINRMVSKGQDPRSAVQELVHRLDAQVRGRQSVVAAR